MPLDKKKKSPCPAQRVVILGFFGPHQFQSFKSSAETLCLNFGQVPYPWVSYQQNPNLYFCSWAKNTNTSTMEKYCWRGFIFFEDFVDKTGQDKTRHLLS